MTKIKDILKREPVHTDYEVIVATNPDSIYAESFRKIPIDIKLSRVDNEPKVIQITSSIAGEHKTTTAVNLAAVYVELGYKVVIIDCDLRKPKMHRAVGLINDEGLTDYLVDKVDYKHLVKKTRFDIDIINSGEKVPFPHVVLRSEKFKNLINQLRNDYDYIIIDSPPVLVVTDSIIISSVCDTTVFVINQRLTKKSETKEAIRILKEANVNIAGIVLSNVTKSLSNYKRYDKYK